MSVTEKQVATFYLTMWSVFLSILRKKPELCDINTELQDINSDFCHNSEYIL